MTDKDEVKLSAIGNVERNVGKLQGFGAEHRKSVIATSALIVVLSASDLSQAALFGVPVAREVLWSCLLVGHAYFFAMWAITARLENERDGWLNLRGLARQMVSPRLVPDADTKTKATLWLIQALPIWAFLVGLGLILLNISILIADYL